VSSGNRKAQVAARIGALCYAVRGYVATAQRMLVGTQAIGR